MKTENDTVQRQLSSAGWLRKKLYWLKQSKKAVIGLTLLFVIAVMTLLSPLIMPYDPFELKVGPKLDTPTLEHIMGTDEYGRDEFSRLLYAMSTTFGIAVVITVLSLLIGGSIGLLSGFLGGRTDLVIMRISEIIFSLPCMLLAITISAIVGLGVQVIILTLIIVYSVQTLRMVRGVSMAIRGQEYIEAAYVSGESTFSVITHYILPNCLSPIIIQASSIFGGAILNEAAISYLGLGLQKPYPSMGMMLSNGATYIYDYLGLSIFPGLAIVITVLAVNLLGDGLRDLFDPKYSKLR